MLRVGALAVASAVVTARCAASGGCLGDTDCANGTYCTVANVCHVDCTTDTECTGGRVCDLARGRCSSPDDAGTKKDAGSADDAGDAGNPIADAPAADVVTTDPDATTPADAGPPADTSAPPTDVVAPMDTPPMDVVVDAGTTDTGPADTGPADTGPIDTGPVDTGPRDTGPADTGPVDTGPPDTGVRGGYLDPCTTDANCITNHCYTNPTGARWCTQTCAANSDCGVGFECAMGVGGPGLCVPDDTGVVCTPATSSMCARYCLGNSIGTGHCTRECRVAADCPAGFGCQDAPGLAGVRLCIVVEQPCNSGADCVSGLCYVSNGTGFCSSFCRSATDCPVRMTVNPGTGVPTHLSPYQCQLLSGVPQTVCVPPVTGVATGVDRIIGNHPLGGACGSVASNLCISGICDPSTSTCVQGCTPTGGCPPGFACKPMPDGADVYMTCQRAVFGSVAVNGTCARAADCATGLCLPGTGGTAYCTRYCPDRLCPTGMHCMADGTAYDGTPLSLCMR